MALQGYFEAVVYRCKNDETLYQFTQISYRSDLDNWESDADRARSGVQNLLRYAGFSGVYILPWQKEKSFRSGNFHSNTWNIEKGKVNSKYYRERQRTCNILMIITYLMMSKLIFLLMDCETLNQLPALEQVRDVGRDTSNISDETFGKNS